MNTNINYAILSDTHKITDAQSKQIVSELYAKTNWQKSTLSSTLAELLLRDELIVIKTDNITVIDFDDDIVFNQALQFNSGLSEDLQCGLIIKSTRRGGHFYYLPNPSIDLPLEHTKQHIVDILTTIKHNVIAPTKADEGKIIVHQANKLTKYNTAINTFVTLHVLQNLPMATRAMALHSGERRSDDAQDFVKGYLANIITQESFDKFYNIPSPIPEGQSNQVYLSLSTRLGSDETISPTDYEEAMTKFNQGHDMRKSAQELKSTITQRMVDNSNGLWRYDPKKETSTFTTTHRRYKTQISTYFDSSDGSYIIHFLNQEGTSQLHIVGNTSAYCELLEKVSNLSRAQLRNATNRVASVEVIADYTQEAGYNHKESTYNRAFINSNLTAFTGTQPLAYSHPTKMIEMLQYMWGESYEYLLSTTKHRYSTFQYSPVVTFLQGTEGSGKDLTIALLSAGFSHPAQTLNYQLMKDKHSNWQTEENAVFSEVGDWKPMERDDLLAELKTISGSNGRVTFRDMQKTAKVVPTLIKIWVTGNQWFKLHSDPLTQRRIHIVYMPRPLMKDMGGDYSPQDVAEMMSEQSLQNFYYWLGNVYEPTNFTIDMYNSAMSQQKTEAYQMYIEDVESSSDKVSALLWSRTYNDLISSLKIYNVLLEDLAWKYSKSKNLVVSVSSLKQAFARNSGGDVISKTINRLASEKEGNKRLMFPGKTTVEKFVTFFDAPDGLEKVTPIEGVSDDSNY